MRKLFLSALMICMMIANGAFAHEWDIEGAKKANKVRDNEIGQYFLRDVLDARETTSKPFENDLIKTEVKLCVVINSDLGHLKNMPNTTIYGNKGRGLGKVHVIAKTPGVWLNITNKTDKVMEIDLDKSMISVAGYQGRGIRGDVRKMDSASVQQAPMVIFPKSSQEIILYVPTGEVLLNTGVNVLGNFILCVNGEYVTFTYDTVINANKLHWAVKPEVK